MIAPKSSGPRALVKLAALRAVLSDPEDGILARLIAAGRIEKPDGEGRVDIAVAVPLFFTELRAELRASTASASAERARQARAEAAELTLALARRDVIAQDDAAQAIDSLCGAINEALTSLAPRVTRDIRRRRGIEAAAFATRQAVAREVASC